MGSCLSSNSAEHGDRPEGGAGQRQGFTDVTRNANNTVSGGGGAGAGRDGAAAAGTAAAAGSGRSRRSDRRGGSGSGGEARRERTSLERQNTEAREALMVGRGEAPKFKRHGGWEARPAVTRAQLALTRRAFWETADTFGGRRETWEVLQRCVEADDPQTAQAMVEGADIRLLGDGDLVHGCYDPTGFFYKVPEPCLSDPINLLEEEDFDEAELEKLQADGAYASTAPPLSATTDTTVSDAVPEASLVDMKVRMSHTSADILVRVHPAERVASVARKVKQQAGVESLKLMCLGRMLRDDSPRETLESAGWRQGLVVQALVTKV